MQRLSAIFTIACFTFGSLAGCGRTTQELTPAAVQATPQVTRQPEDTKTRHERYATALVILEQEERRLKELEPSMIATCQKFVTETKIPLTLRDRNKNLDRIEKLKKTDPDSAKTEWEIGMQEATNEFQDGLTKDLVNGIKDGNESYSKELERWGEDISSVRKFLEQRERVEQAKKDVEGLQVSK